MASILVAMASNLIALASNLIAMASIMWLWVKTRIPKPGYVDPLSQSVLFISSDSTQVARF